MAIIYDPRTGGHTIRRGGVAIDTLEAARFESMLDDRALEDDLKADLESKASLSNRACAVYIHIFTRDPLNYVLRVASAGYTPRQVDWWEKPTPEKSEDQQ